MQNVAIGAWFDTPSVIAKSEALHTAIAGELARLRELIRRSRERRLAHYVQFPFTRRIAGGAELDGVPIIGAVLAKLSAGILPTTSPTHVWAGKTTGGACQACDERIGPGQDRRRAQPGATRLRGEHRFLRRSRSPQGHGLGQRNSGGLDAALC
jgi:hypothetical protein